MSRDALGGLVGRNGRWVKAVERGEIAEPKLPLLLSIAEALRLRDLAALTGKQTVPVDHLRGPGHPALPEVRSAVNTLVLPTGEPAPLDRLRTRLDAAWWARHAAPDHRTVLGALLPALIRDARHAARAYDGAARRHAHALLAEVYALSQFYLAYQPAADLLWRVVERSVMAAEESEDPRALARSAWLAAQAHRDSADWDAAETVNREGLELLAQHADTPDPEVRALWGALHHEVAYTAARAGRAADAWAWWDRADAIAQALPADFYEPMTSFSRVVMGAHATTIAVETRQRGEAVRQATRTADAEIPSAPRRGRHLVEVARAWEIAGDRTAVVGTLDQAYRAAPETVRYNGYARRMALSAASEPGSQQRPARALVDRIVLT